MFIKIFKNMKGNIKMVKEKITINNETGLHARPATEIAKIAMKYPCSINLVVNGKEISAKSPLMIMSAGIKQKTDIEVLCDGVDEEKALKELITAFEGGFGE